MSLSLILLMYFIQKGSVGVHEIESGLIPELFLSES